MFRVFQYQDLGELRVHIYDDTFWFVAADLVNFLGHEDAQFLTAEYVSFADKGMTAEAPDRYILTVNECGAYSLICGIRNSRSGKLLHWLVNDVIPELRKPITPIAPAVDVSEITVAPATEKNDFSHITKALTLHYGEPKPYHFSNEYNMLNKLVLGMTAKEYRKAHDIKSNKSIRPYLTADEIKRLEMLEIVDMGLIAANLSFNERKEKLTVFMNKYAS